MLMSKEECLNKLLFITEHVLKDIFRDGRQIIKNCHSSLSWLLSFLWYSSTHVQTLLQQATAILLTSDEVSFPKWEDTSANSHVSVMGYINYP